MYGTIAQVAERLPCNEQVTASTAVSTSMHRHDTKEYMRDYMKKRYWSRREEALDILGGVCVVCGARENLEIDHVNRVDKTMTFERMSMVSRIRFLNELSKCQLLCKRHHIDKTTIDDLGRKDARRSHGTVSSYRYCRCEDCKTAKSIYNRSYKKASLAKKVTATAS